MNGGIIVNRKGIGSKEQTGNREVKCWLGAPRFPGVFGSRLVYYSGPLSISDIPFRPGTSFAWLNGNDNHSKREKVSMAKGRIRSVKDMRVWQIGMKISITCYRLTNQFPKHELYGLTSQIRRAAVSIPANIAEGFGRANPGDNHRHLSIAQGSLKELETLLEISTQLDYPDNGLDEVVRNCDELGKMMWALIEAVKRRRQNEKSKSRE